MFLFPKVRVLGLDFEEINDFSKEISGELFELDWFLYGGNIKRLNVIKRFWTSYLRSIYILCQGGGAFTDFELIQHNIKHINVVLLFIT